MTSVLKSPDKTCMSSDAKAIAAARWSILHDDSRLDADGFFRKTEYLLRLHDTGINGESVRAEIIAVEVSPDMWNATPRLSFGSYDCVYEFPSIWNPVCFATKEEAYETLLNSMKLMLKTLSTGPGCPNAIKINAAALWLTLEGVDSNDLEKLYQK